MLEGQIRQEMAENGRIMMRMLGCRKLTYELLNVHHDSDKGDLLLFNTLRDQIVLEQVRIVYVAAHIAALSLLATQALLALARTGGEQLNRYFPAEQLLKSPASRRLISATPLVKRPRSLAADLLSRSEHGRLLRITLHHYVGLRCLDRVLLLGEAHDLVELPLSEVLPCVVLHQ